MMMTTMMMTTTRRKTMTKADRTLLCAAIGAALLLAGCERIEPSARERAERASRGYTAAMAELQAGRIDAAIKGFEDVIRDEPGNGNAHFQLAALLEDSKKDFLGAIVHYRLYMMIRPKSDKASIAADRLRGCETRYAAMAVEKAGLDNQFATELEKLRKEHEQCGKKAAKLSESLDEANRKIASLEREVAMKGRMLEKAGSIADDPTVAKTARKSLRPTDAELLNDDSDEGGKLISKKDIKTLREMLDEDDRTAPKKISSGSVADMRADDVGVPQRPSIADSGATNAAPSEAANPFAKKKEKKPKRLIPETYTVEEGDTLMRISAKFYGTNHKWRAIREANKTIISPDGRVKVGQVIKLP
jgi:LysM repeat protein